MIDTGGESGGRGKASEDIHLTAKSISKVWMGWKRRILGITCIT